MIKILKDIIRHTYSLGGISFIKLEGRQVKAMSDDNSIVVRGTLNDNIFGSDGSKVGLANLPTLKNFLEFPSFNEDEAKVFFMKTKNKDGVEYPRCIIFTSGENHKVQYNLMSAEQADARIKVPKMANLSADISIVPTQKNLKDLQYFNGAMSSYSKLFNVVTNNGTLEFHLGDENSCQAVVPVSKNVLGTLNKEVFFPVLPVINVLKLMGEDTCTSLSIVGNAGMVIEMVSPYGEYHFMLPSKKKIA